MREQREANPFMWAIERMSRLMARSAPRYATVVSVSSPTVTVTPLGESVSITCDASTAVIAAAAPGDVVWVVPTGSRWFAAAIRQS